MGGDDSKGQSSKVNDVQKVEVSVRSSDGGSFGDCGSSHQGDGRSGVSEGQGLEEDVFNGNSLIQFYAECGDLDYAWKVFDEMLERNTVLGTSLICGYGWRDMTKEAFFLFFEMGLDSEAVLVMGEMLQQGLRPDKVMCHISFCQLSDSLSGKCSHGYVLRNGLEGWDTICNAMIDMYKKCSQPEMACIIFDNMSNKTTEGIKGDTVTMVEVASACGYLGAIDLAKWTHAYIGKDKINCDMRLGTSLVDMFARCGNPQSAIKVFDNMARRDVSAWTAAIGAMAMQGNGERALELFDNMHKQGVKPDEVVFVAVLTACSHAGGLEEAVDLVKSMPMEPNDVIWGTLLAACQTHKNVKMAAYAAEQVSKLTTQRAGIHVLVSNIYASAGKWADIAKVRLQLKEAGMQKVPGCSSVEVNGVIHELPSVVILIHTQRRATLH
ncbi:pentatricopeptide repeat-containing protein At3g22690 [Rosa chinensis]|uniref:pentatricopeptide repeat-containing protein At3g22690 n=1 Tax=Rosa chinensis TaxID=74649 RepID=UPI000D090311|nr:pentatricopeptide repeat-containing protein At3g22690 [Rosa chinensis]